MAAGLPAIGYGETSNHIFVTSSWGKPRNGPGELPSYQVMNLTYWEAQWAVRYEERQCVEWGEIVNKEGEIETVCARWDWIAQFDGWYPIDLRRFGNPNWYFTRRVLEPAPVIEVQGVIGRPE